MKKKLHGFVISWFYPPGNSSEGLVTYKLLKNSGFTYDVFTRKTYDATIWDRKVNESGLTADNVSVLQANTDDEQEWVNEAVEYFKQHADEYDFVMSRVMPAESHVAAAKIKALFPDILWLASFGDPLSKSPYIKVVDKAENPFFLKEYYLRETPSAPKLAKLAVSPTRFARKKVWEKERVDEMAFTNRYKAINDLTFKNADVLIFNNQQQFDRAFTDEDAQYIDKGVIINHSFDKTLYPKNVAAFDDGKIHFVYVGHLDAMRNATPLFDALGIVKQNDPKISKKAQFDFYGHIDDSDKVAIVDNDISDLVSLHNDIGYVDSLAKMMQADWLVLIDTNLNSVLEEYIYLPAKLADYFGSKKSILAITQLRGTTANAMAKVGAGQVVTHCADEIALYLAKIIYQEYNPTKYCKKAWEEYDARKVAQKFDEVVLQKLEQK